MSDLDERASRILAGKVVRKDLVQRIKEGSVVPTFVLEYLLGKYCATDDPVAMQAGLSLVQSSLVDNFVRPDEANKAQSMVREQGRHMFIDKIRVKYVSDDDTYWAEMVNFGHQHVHIPEKYIREYDRLLTGGIWAQVTVRHEYDDTVRGKRSPFWIDELKPIQIATFDMDAFLDARRQFSTDDWLDLLIRTIGLEPSHFDRRLKLLLLSRLIPLCEQNFNLIELGPRGTGKSYAFQQISPYSILLTGRTTVANLFYNMNTRRIGLVGLWDAVAFDEVAELSDMPGEVFNTLKTYCESGTFARGKDNLSGHASIAMFGNINQSVDVLVRSSHLFAPLPETVRNDLAFLDRIHFYLPGWEIPKMRSEFFTEHYGFVVDYLAEALRELRKYNMTDIINQHFELGTHLNARDARAVRKTAAGLLKIVFPTGEAELGEIEELLCFAMEGRRRVKEQLKKIGSFEYHQTSFSYVHKETREESYVSVPEEGDRSLISSDPLAPGSIYCVHVDDEGRAGLWRLEIATSSGTGRLRITGTMPRVTRQSVERAFSYIKGHKTEMGLGSDIDERDFHVESVNLVGSSVVGEVGTAFVLAVYSVLKNQPSVPALVVLGDVTVQGNVKRMRSLSEPLQLARDSGAKRALIPLENKEDFVEVSTEIAESVDPIFYGDLESAVSKALG